MSDLIKKYPFEAAVLTMLLLFTILSFAVAKPYIDSNDYTTREELSRKLCKLDTTNMLLEKNLIEIRKFNENGR